MSGDMQSSDIEYSIVVPVYNEEESLELLWSAIQPVMDEMGGRWEVIFCDDGSTDKSRNVLEKLSQADSRVRVIVFRRNFGQSAAMAAGFDHARGGVIIPMDADLQNDPKDIPRLLAEMREKNLDVVKGWRHKRKDTYLTKTLPSRIANALISRVTGVRLHDYGCTLTVYSAEIAKDIHIYGEMHRFLPAFAHWAGARIGEIKVTHHPRRFGTSKYNLSKTFRVILDIMTVRFLVGYSTKPLYFFGKWGFGALLIGGLASGWTLFKKFYWGIALYKDPFFLVAIFCGIAGLQILLIGLIAELNARIYYESQRKPPYHIRETINLVERKND
jgi:glycosyltransferase involved in cell wall biosynthesis